ncbi:MAG: SNF2-related protein [Gammaproteobacteria bacterium]|nr:SNF2-related protein [Gammaproteobacteria bacterium]
MHPIHRRYYAEDLVRQRRAGERRRQVSSQRRGRVDPNPHQIDAVMFALRRIPEGGCILADEVGLGKTIEAGLVIAQLLAEGATRILIVVPRPLLGQWQAELVDLFDIEALEAADPSVDTLGPGVFLAGREYAGGETGASRLGAAPWDLCLIDEAHEVFAGIHRRYDRAGIYDEESPQALLAHRVRRVIGASPVLLLTATPIQNSLRELWGLVQYVDPSGTLLGDKPVFEGVFCADDGRGVAAHQSEELRQRLATVVQRTLRRQAQEFLDRPFVGRRAQLFEYRMSPDERALYDDVTDYLLSPTLHAFKGAARQLLLLGFHRRMASSIPALAESLDRVASRLRGMLGDADAGETAAADFVRDLEEEDDIDEGGAGMTAVPMPPPALEAAAVRSELERVEDFVRRARALPRDSKAASLVQAVRMVLDRPVDRRKVVIFTESLTTQDYLRELLLEQTELRDDDITLFRGNNDSPRARAALDGWRAANGHGARAPSASVAVRLALVDEFRHRSTVMISSEAGAKGLNLQFCDTVINYDLPWNPQRIEQRIGRCHRYGQKRDVTVINFLARDNQAQRLTFDILSTKLDLFGDVLDMSDVVLQTPRSDASQELVSALGPDFEGELRRIWERARSVAEVEEELRRLGESMEGRRLALERVRERTVGLIETSLDNSVRDVFRRIRTDLRAELATFDAELERMLTAYLDAAEVPWSADKRDERRVVHIGASARLPAAVAGGVSVSVGGSAGKGLDTLHLSHPLIAAAVAEARATGADFRVRFDLGPNAPAALRERRGRRGRLALTRIAHRGYEREDRLRVTAVFEDAEVLRPADAALDLIRQPCADAPPFDPPLLVTAEDLEEVVEEELFFDRHELAGADESNFRDTMDQLDRYLADRTLVLRRARERQQQRLVAAESARDRAMGAEQRGRTDNQVRNAEIELERIDRQIGALEAKSDDTYERARQQAHRRRYAAPTVERLLVAAFEIA